MITLLNILAVGAGAMLGGLYIDWQEHRSNYRGHNPNTWKDIHIFDLEDDGSPRAGNRRGKDILVHEFLAANRNGKDCL